MRKKIQEFLIFAYPIFIWMSAMIFTFIGDFNRSIFFILLYVICIIDERLKNIHKAISVLWYRIYLRNKKDGIE